MAYVQFLYNVIPVEMQIMPDDNIVLLGHSHGNEGRAIYISSSPGSLWKTELICYN